MDLARHSWLATYCLISGFLVYLKKGREDSMRERSRERFERASALRLKESSMVAPRYL